MYIYQSTDTHTIYTYICVCVYAVHVFFIRIHHICGVGNHYLTVWNMPCVWVYFANGHGCELHVNVNLYSKLDHINFPKWNEKKNRKRRKKSCVLLYEAFAFAFSILRHCHLKREREQLTSLLLILSVNLFFSCFSSYFIIILLTNFMCVYMCLILFLNSNSSCVRMQKNIYQ